MELVNADYGIDSVPKDARKRTWYRHYKFPLLPMFEYRPGDGWNAPDFNFSWLLLRVHTGMSPQFVLGLHLDEHGVRLVAHLPYLYITLWLLPLPNFISQWSYRHLWRLGKETPR